MENVSRGVVGVSFAVTLGVLAVSALAADTKGLLIAGGGFTDESGGAAVFEAADDAAAGEIVAADPAVTSNVFRFELQRWRPNPWEEISKRSAARGE